LELDYSYLEHFDGLQNLSCRVLLFPLPFRIGRSSSSNLVICAKQVSTDHAEIYASEGQYFVRDLKTKNGTFVNGQAVQNAVLGDGDILHVAHEEFRFISGAGGKRSCPDSKLTELAASPPPQSMIRTTILMREMIEEKNVRVIFQPIVNLETRKPVGYEALGRGTHGELSAKPSELLDLADRCGMAGELSHTFRMAAIAAALRLAPQRRIFFNLHPAELGRPLLLKSLEELRSGLANCHRLVLEVHEDCVADVATLRALRNQLQELGIELAYDDFGAGQSRLRELAEIPPDFIKLDMRLIRNIHLTPARQDMVRAFGQVAHGLGVKVIAEGIEKPEEAAVCQSLGCELGQGYLFGRPQSAAVLEQCEGETHLMDVSQLRERLKSRGVE
jgi:EAL domain-containing protein (putative c-di-GMP-specific phosphodiesterase class I)